MRAGVVLAGISVLAALLAAPAPAQAAPPVAAPQSAPEVAPAPSKVHQPLLLGPGTVYRNQIIMLRTSFEYRRPAEVQELLHGHWKVIASTAGSNAQTPEVPPNTAKKRTFRVYAPAGWGDAAGLTNKVTVRVVLSPRRFAKQVSLGGGEDGCLLTMTGQARCWGGQYAGNGKAGSSRAPVGVTKLGSGNRLVKAGPDDGCAITKSRTVKCWGNNYAGQLGDGTTKTRLAPVAVKGLKDAKSLVVALDHTCALTRSGAVWCWGSNEHGHLGDQTTVDRHTPVRVLGLTGTIAAISGGTGFNCALTTAGAVSCWGLNDQGQLGDGTTDDRSTAVPVSGLSSGVVAINSGSRSTCALLSGGKVTCWGWMAIGTIADAELHTVPTAVPGASGFTAIGVGEDMTCGLTGAGAVRCWGSSNSEGQLGHGATSTVADDSWLVPATVNGLSKGVTSLSVKGLNGCVVLKSGKAKCWGVNYQGALGNGGQLHQVVPTLIAGIG